MILCIISLVKLDQNITRALASGDSCSSIRTKRAMSRRNVLYITKVLILMSVAYKKSATTWRHRAVKINPFGKARKGSTSCLRMAVDLTPRFRRLNSQTRSFRLNAHSLGQCHVHYYINAVHKSLRLISVFSLAIKRKRYRNWLAKWT